MISFKTVKKKSEFITEVMKLFNFTKNLGETEQALFMVPTKSIFKLKCNCTKFIFKIKKVKED